LIYGAAAVQIAAASILGSTKTGNRAMKHLVARFRKNASGATAIEYGLLSALIAVALYGAISGLTPKIAGLYESAAEAIPKD
jgi:pilus assembly protein Flp/PilA